MSLLAQEEETSPLAPKKIKMKTPVKKRQKVIRKAIPFPLILEVIPEEEEEDDEDKEDNLPLSQRNHLARATRTEWRRSSTITPPSIPT